MDLTFAHADEFAAMRQAERWCEQRGISVGHAQKGQPRGLLVGSYDIQKWRNLSMRDRDALDGAMTGDMRNGPVKVWMREGAKWAEPEGV